MLTPSSWTRPWVGWQTHPLRQAGRWYNLLCDSGPGTDPLCASVPSTGNGDRNSPNRASPVRSV